MRNISLIILISILLTSCLTEKRILKHCEDFAKVCGTTTVTETKYRDTVIRVDRRVPVFLPHDTARLASVVRVTDHGAQMGKQTVRQGIVSISSEIENSQLRTTAWINRDSLVVAIEDSIRLHNAVKETSIKANTVIREKYIPQLYKISLWLLIGEVVVVLLWLGFRIARLFK